MKKEMRAKLYEAYKKIYSRCDDCDDMAMYCTGKTLMCFELRGKLVPIEKCNIETQFPFGYDYPLGNRTMDNAFALSRLARTSECFFAKLNHEQAGYSKLINKINNSKKKWIALPCYSKDFDEDRIVYDIVEVEDDWTSNNEEEFILTKKELNNYRKILAKCAKLHQSKIKAYLHKYGLSRVNSWTYDSLE